MPDLGAAPLQIERFGEARNCAMCKAVAKTQARRRSADAAAMRRKVMFQSGIEGGIRHGSRPVHPLRANFHPARLPRAVQWDRGTDVICSST
jgi:hypothetical protein